MFSDKNNLTSEELSRQAEEQKENLRASRNIFLKTGVFVLAAVTVIIVLTIAWFVQNNSVRETDGDISAKYDGVEIGSKGKRGVHDDWLRKVNKNIKYDLPGEDENWKHDTSKGADINWLLNDTSNMGNYDADKLMGETGSEKRTDYAIEPGSKGVMDFYIRTDSDGAYSMDFSLDITPYKVKSGLTTEEDYKLVTDSMVKTLLRGHILYYLKTEKTTDGVETAEYTWIEDGKFHIDIPDAEKGKEYNYSIYWVWPLSLGPVLLNKGDDFLNDHDIEFSDIDSTGQTRETIISDMQQQPQKYFYSSLTGKALDGTYEEVAAISEIHKNSGMNGTYNRQLFVDLSSYYNQADMKISDTISFIQVSLRYLGKAEESDDKE